MGRGLAVSAAALWASRWRASGAENWEKVLKATGNYPLHRHVRDGELTEGDSRFGHIQSAGPVLCRYSGF